MTDATFPSHLPLEWLETSSGRLAFRHYPGAADRDLPGVLYLGGFQSSMDGEKAQFLVSECLKRGQQVTCFDYRGHGETGGDMAGLGIASWRDDAVAVLDKVCKGPQILAGSSMGGWVMTLVWQARPGRVTRLAGIAAAPDFTEDLIRPKLTADHLADLARQGYIRVDSRYDPEGYEITASLLEQGAQNRVLDKRYKIDIPVALLHGDADPDVPAQQSQKLYDCFDGEDVSLTLLKGGDHRLSADKWLRHVGRVVFG